MKTIQIRDDRHKRIIPTKLRVIEKNIIQNNFSERQTPPTTPISDIMPTGKLNTQYLMLNV